jgi:hypothetical protein
MTGLNRVPRKYMKILLNQENGGFQFVLKGCNCGKELIPASSAAS